MKPEFSFTYGDVPFRSETLSAKITDRGAEYILEEGITVTLVKAEYSQFQAVEWTLLFQNNTEKDSVVFSEIRDCDLYLPIREKPYPHWAYRWGNDQAHVITMNGMVDGLLYKTDDEASSREYGMHTDFLNVPRHYENLRGRSSDGTMPFFRVEADGVGAIIAIGWSGDWRADFAKENGSVWVRTGMKRASFYLKSGETIRTTSVLIMEYTDSENAHNQFRRLLKHRFPAFANPSTERKNLLAFELWGDLPSDEMFRRIHELNQFNVGFEQIWIDAGWYGSGTEEKRDWNRCTGDWVANKRAHPDELDGVAAKIKECGMEMLLWVEPERAHESTPIVQAHPEWFLRQKENGKQDPFAILNLGNDRAWQYAFEMICGLIERYDIRCYRQDFNISPHQFFAQNDSENRIGITEIKHITGLYRLWDALLKKYPGLLIDNCASGGRRIDIETLKRSVPFFRSDYQCAFDSNPEVLQTHNANISFLLPLNGCTNKTKSDTYAIRSSYSAGWGGAFYNYKFQSMDEKDFEWARKIVEEYRRIRNYFSKDYYNHGSLVYDPTAWAIWQYHDADVGKGIVMAFRREKSPFPTAEIKLQGVPTNAAIRFLDREKRIEWKGDPTVLLSLTEKRSSMILEYEVEK